MMGSRSSGVKGVVGSRSNGGQGVVGSGVVGI